MQRAHTPLGHFTPAPLPPGRGKDAKLGIASAQRSQSPISLLLSLVPGELPNAFEINKIPFGKQAIIPFLLIISFSSGNLPIRIQNLSENSGEGHILIACTQNAVL